MKFGKNLSRNQVPEWSHSYIKYRVLKKLIGRITEGEKVGAAFDTTGKDDYDACCHAASRGGLTST